MAPVVSWYALIITEVLYYKYQNLGILNFSSLKTPQILFNTL